MQENYCHLLTWPIGSTILHFTDAGNSFDYNGSTFLAGFIKSDSIPDIPQTSAIKENQVNFELYDLDNSISTLLLSSEWKHKRPVLDEIVYNADGSILEVNRLYRGKVDDFEIMHNDKTKTVTLICKDTLAADKQRGRRTNNISQHQYDSTDFCFEYTPVASKEMPWGREGTLQALGNGNGAIRGRRHPKADGDIP